MSMSSTNTASCSTTDSVWPQLGDTFLAFLTECPRYSYLCLECLSIHRVGDPPDGTMKKLCKNVFRPLKKMVSWI